VERNLKKFNSKRTALPLGQSNPLQQDRLETTGMKAALQDRAWKHGWTASPGASSAPAQRRPTASRSTASGARGGRTHLCSALVGPSGELGPVWVPQHKDSDVPEQVQQRVPR